MIVTTAIVGTVLVLIGMCFGPTSKEYARDKRNHPRL